MMKDRGTVYLNPEVDSDILNFINNDLKEKFSAYVKRLIRTDMYSNKLVRAVPQQELFQQPIVERVIPAPIVTKQEVVSTDKSDDRLAKLENIVEKLTMQHLLAYGKGMDFNLNIEENQAKGTVYPVPDTKTQEEVEETKQTTKVQLDERELTKQDLIDNVPTSKDYIQSIHQILQQPEMYEKLQELMQKKEEEDEKKVEEDIQQTVSGVEQTQAEQPKKEESQAKKPKDTSIQMDIARLINNQTNNGINN